VLRFIITSKFEWQMSWIHQYLQKHEAYLNSSWLECNLQTVLL
jgi:hypothetical protein